MAPSPRQNGEAKSKSSISAHPKNERPTTQGLHLSCTKTNTQETDNQRFENESRLMTSEENYSSVIAAIFVKED